ncbi:MAG: hypothetical protein NTU88_13490 [Armatimonadetes bacterium]|nr:hypothetical protein [Armatimonadota bacterium]
MRGRGVIQSPPQEAAIEALSTGVAGLDKMLGGGIPMGFSVVVCGSTGSGKTMLAQQMAYTAAAAGHNVLYMADLSGSGTKALRMLLKLSFFDSSAYNVTVSYEDLVGLAKSAMVEDMGVGLCAFARRHRAKLVIIDSIDLALGFAQNPLSVHRGIQSLCSYVSEKDLICLLIAGCQKENLNAFPEPAIADGIILLTAPYESADGKGYVHILKMRGVEHALAAAQSRISSSGLEVVQPSDSEH